MKAILMGLALALTGCHEQPPVDNMMAEHRADSIIFLMKQERLTRPQAEVRYEQYLRDTSGSAKVQYETKQREAVVARVRCNAEPWSSGC